MRTFTHLKAGDKVTRMLAGIIPMELTVFASEGGVIKARVPEIGDDYWQFDAETGAEIDQDLGWGPLYTGSYLVTL
jgi:hypothetical protein